MPWQFAHTLPLSDVEVAFATVAPARRVKVLQLECPVIAQDVGIASGTG